MAAMTPQDYRCPQCGQIDAVSKVSGLVSSGTASYSRMNLASRLSFPFSPPSQPPPYESPWGCGYVVFVIFAVVLALLVLSMEIEIVAGFDYTITVIPAVVFVVLVTIATVRNIQEAKNSKESETS